MAKITNTTGSHIAVRSTDGKDVGLAPGETKDISPDKKSASFNARVKAGALAVGAEAAARVAADKPVDATK